jgi:hypothetical protein
MHHHRGALVLTCLAPGPGAPSAPDVAAQVPASLRINPRTNGPHRNAVVSDLFRMGIARGGAYNRTSPLRDAGCLRTRAGAWDVVGLTTV